LCRPSDEEGNSNVRTVYAVTGALLLGGSALALTTHMPVGAQEATTVQRPVGGAITPRVGAPTSFADLVAQLQPAVVNISTRQRVEVQQRRNPFQGTPLEQFFGQQGQPGQGQPQTRRGSSLGSGFIISADGYIVTNNHVVAPGAPNAVVEQITVTMPDRTEYTARVVGRDPDSDLAVLKIEATNLPFVRFGDSARTRVGDWIVAIGNPLGFGGTVTSGIVSALYRNVGPGGPGTGGAFDRYIQTDAAINQGNSGGPMFDMAGSVIGINSAIISPNGGNIGLGFAIPAEVAEPIVRQLIEGRAITRGYLGLERVPVNEDLAASLGIPNGRGEFIQRVAPGQAAERAGIRAGDVILRVAGQDVSPDNTLSYVVANIRPGTRIPIELLRDGRRMTVTATVGTRPSAEELAAEAQSQPVFNPDEEQEFSQRAEPNRTADQLIRDQLGLATVPLTAEIAAQVGVDSSTRGLVIAAVNANSDAAQRGLGRGFVIIGANNRPVTSHDDLAAVITEARRQNRQVILLQVTRRGLRPAFLPVRLAGG
jgi:serine protease Do